MRVSQKRLMETFEVFNRELCEKFGGDVRLWVTDPGLPNAIYMLDTDTDLFRGSNGEVWTWIIEQSALYTAVRG